MKRPDTAAQAIASANAEYVCHWYTSGCGRIELALSVDDARSGSHSGQCDEDIAELLKVPYIAEQLAGISPEVMRAIALESGRNDYGRGDADNNDHAANTAFVLWMACGDIVEQMP